MVFIALFLGHNKVEASYQGKVNATSLNVRAEASNHSTILGRLKTNEVVSINNVNGKWGEITYKSKKAYVSLDYIIKTSTTDNSSTKKGIVTATKLNIRSNPDTYSTIIGQYKNNESIEYSVSNNKWGKVTYNNKTGYIYLSFIKETKEDKVENVEKIKMYPDVTTTLNVRQSPDTYSTIVGRLTKNDIVEVENYSSKWGKITFNNKPAYVYLTYMVKASPTPVSKPTVEKFGTVHATSLNIRSGPGTQFKSMGILKNGAKITVLDVSGEWARFTFTNKPAYVHASFLKIEDKKNETPLPPKQGSDTTEIVTKGYVKNVVDSLNVRESSNTTSKIIGKLKNKAEVSIVSVANGWAKIKFNNGYGFVSMEFISYDKPQPNPNPIPAPTVPVQPVKVYKYIVNATSLNVRDASGLNGKIIGIAKNGTELQVTQELNNGWHKIKWNNRDGFVSAEFVNKVDSANQNSSTYISLKGKTIVIDAGHGGRDVGAIGNSMYEKNVVLDVATKLKSELERNGAMVVMTRSTDIYLTLKERYTISNNSNADAFVSIHNNASTNPSANGVESYYHPSANTTLKNASYELTSSIHQELLTTSKISNRGVKTASFSVIKYNNKPSTLLELGFISNQYDSSMLRDNNFKINTAKAITRGLANYFN